MSLNIRIPIPISSDVNRVALKSSGAEDGTFTALPASPFTIRTQGIWLREVTDTAGTNSVWYKRAWVNEAGSTGGFSSAFQQRDPYCSPRDIWHYFNRFQRVRDELLTTNGSSAIVYSVSGSSDVSGVNIIEGTYEVKCGTSSTVTTELVEKTDYYIDLDDGKVVFTSAGTSGANNKNVWISYDKADLPNGVMRDVVDNASRALEYDTGRVFNSASYVEYFSVEGGEGTFLTSHYPHINTPTIEENASGATGTPNWLTRSSGLGNDFLSNDKDKDVGRIRFIDNKPLAGTDNLRITYDAGFVTIPYDVRRLATLYTAKELLMNPSYAKSFIAGHDLYNNAEFKYIEMEIDRLKKKYVAHKIIKV